MIFSNGKVIVTGAKSEKECELSSIKLAKKMSKFGLLKSLKPKTNFKIQNIVATISTKLTINL
jgi:TATA-box binding protein (TBP) (component of TFIID and TFIIIB)